MTSLVVIVLSQSLKGSPELSEDRLDRSGEASLPPASECRIGKLSEVAASWFTGYNVSCNFTTRAAVASLLVASQSNSKASETIGVRECSLVGFPSLARAALLVFEACGFGLEERN